MILKQTKSIGLIVPLLSNEYWSTLAEQVQEAAWELGYTLLFCSAGYTTAKKVQCFKTLAERKVDGIITGVAIQDADELAKLQQTHLANMPLVALDYSMADAQYMISADQFQASVKAVSHLIQLGHSRIAYIGNYPTAREAAYRHALELHSIPVDESIIIRGDGSFASGSRAVSHILQEKLPVTALFCWNDMTALGAMQSLQKAGLRIPGDMSIVGYDDIPMASLVSPALTSVRQPLVEIGRSAVHTLIAEIEGGEKDTAARSIIHATELMIRESSGPCPERHYPNESMR